MVESNVSSSNGDGIIRNVKYAKWREDKPADANYSPELVNLTLDPKYYDNMNAIPPYKEGMLTFLDYFEDHVK